MVSLKPGSMVLPGALETTAVQSPSCGLAASAGAAASDRAAAAVASIRVRRIIGISLKRGAAFEVLLHLGAGEPECAEGLLRQVLQLVGAVRGAGLAGVAVAH